MLLVCIVYNLQDVLEDQDHHLLLLVLETQLLQQVLVVLEVQQLLDLPKQHIDIS